MQNEDSRLRNQRVFVLPNGLDKENRNMMSGSIVIMIGTGNMAGGRGRMVLIDDPPQSARSLEEKAGEILVHLLKYPLESEMKLNYYVSSWADTPDIIDSFFDKDYLEWFKRTVTSIPSVKSLCKALGGIKTAQLPSGLINVLFWLLIGLREPKLVPLSDENAKEVANLFAEVRQMGRVKRVFKVEKTVTENNIRKNDLLRFEYGFLSESTDNIFGFLYHFHAVGSFQFFMDQISHALQNSVFEKSKWAGSELNSRNCTLLVLEWTPSLARLFMNIESLDIPTVDEPNVFCTFSPAGIRISYVILLEPKFFPVIIPRHTKNMLSEGVFLCASISFCFLVIRLIFHNMLWPLR